MKYLTWLCAIFAVCIVGCEKNQQVIQEPKSDSIETRENTSETSVNQFDENMVGIDLETRDSTNTIANIQLDAAFGQSVSVSINPSNTEPKRYFVNPIFIPQNKANEENYSKACKTGTQKAVMNYSMVFWPQGDTKRKSFEQEIAEKLTEYLGDKNSIKASQIAAYPYFKYQLYYNDGNSFTLISNPSIGISATGAIPGNTTNIQRGKVTQPTVSLPCQMLLDVVNNPSRMKAVFYTVVDHAAQNTVSIKYKDVLKEIINDQAANNQSQKGAITQSTFTSNRGGAIEFNGVNIGGNEGSTGVSIEDSRVRYVNDKYLQDKIRTYLNNTSVYERIEDDQAAQASIVEQMLAEIKSKVSTITLMFTQENGRWLAKTDEKIGQVFELSTPLSFEFTPDRDYEQKTETKAGDGNVSIGESKSTKYADKNNVKFEFKNGQWVPIQGTFIIISKAKLINDLMNTYTFVKIKRDYKAASYEANAISEGTEEEVGLTQRVTTLEQDFSKASTQHAEYVKQNDARIKGDLGQLKKELDEIAPSFKALKETCTKDVPNHDTVFIEKKLICEHREKKPVRTASTPKTKPKS